MATKQFKNEKIEYYKKQFENAKVAVVTDYRGLSVEEITELRRNLQKENADLTVTKNTLCKVASKGSLIDQVVNVFKLDKDYQKFDLEVVFSDGTKKEYKREIK